MTTVDDLLEVMNDSNALIADTLNTILQAMKQHNHELEELLKKL